MMHGQKNIKLNNYWSGPDSTCNKRRFKGISRKDLKWILLRSALFWYFTRRRLVSHRRFGTTYRSHFKSLGLLDF